MTYEDRSEWPSKATPFLQHTLAHKTGQFRVTNNCSNAEKVGGKTANQNLSVRPNGNPDHAGGIAMTALVGFSGELVQWRTAPRTAGITSAASNGGRPPGHVQNGRSTAKAALALNEHQIL